MNKAHLGLIMIGNKLLTTAKNDALKKHLTETDPRVAVYLKQEEIER